MTSVTVTERNMMITGVKNGAVDFDFRWHRAPRFENTMGHAPALHKQLRYKV